MNNITGSLEDYLEAIYVLQQNNGEVRITDIAQLLNISKPSVNKAVKVLKESGLVIHEKYQKISLTPEGEKIAKEVDFRHKILMKFLIECLDINPKIAEQDACRIEHVISTESFQRLTSYLEKQI